MRTFGTWSTQGDIQVATKMLLLFQGLIQEYYEGGGYCCGDWGDKCMKHTNLGGSGGMPLLKSACSEIESGAISGQSDPNSSLFSKFKGLMYNRKLKCKHDKH